MLSQYVDELIWMFNRLVNQNLSVTLFSNHCTTQCIFFLIAEVVSKLVNALYIFKIDIYF